MREAANAAPGRVVEHPVEQRDPAAVVRAEHRQERAAKERRERAGPVEAVIADAVVVQSTGLAQPVAVVLVLLVDVVRLGQVEQELRVVPGEGMPGEDRLDHMLEAVRLVLRNPAQDRLASGPRSGPSSVMCSI